MRFKKIIKIIAWLCLGFVLICLFLFINFPNIVEWQIQKRLVQFSDSNDVEFDIQKIGVFNTFISKIQISKAISIDSINIDYDIKNFSSIHLTKVTISGLSLYARLDENNKIKFDSLKLPNTSKDQTRQPYLSFLPFVPDKIVLQNAKIVLHALNNEFLIPFDVLSTIDAKDGKILARAMLYPFGEKIEALVNYDVIKGVEFLKVQGKSFDLVHINPFISKKPNGVQLKGQVDFNLETDSPEKKWKINLSGASIAQPIEASLEEFSSTLSIDNQRINASGTFSLSHLMLPVTQMEYAGTMDFNNDYYFDLILHNGKTEPEPYQIIYESIACTLKNLQLNARFFGTPSRANGQITIDVGQGRIQHQKDSLIFSDAKISSDMAMDFTDKGKGVSSKITSTANNIMLKSELAESSFSAVNLSGSFLLDKNNTPWASMILKASKGEITSPEFKTKASGLIIEVPIQYPNIDKKIYGRYFIPEISYNNQYNFSTAGKILQTDLKEFQVSGGVSLLTLPDLKTQFSSIVGFKKGLYASLDFKIDPVKLNYADIEKFIPQKLQVAEVDVTASAKGKAEFLNHQLKTSMGLNIKDGKIHIQDTNFTATGINTMMEFNDLIALETVPGQVLTIDSIEVNKIKIENAKIRFTIEDGKSWLVENIRFKWCNGLVSTESIRFPQENNAYFLTLYCDRLEMTQLLKQMGAFNAQGSGTLNGRIPVIYSDGNISFDNGFLFSTPGKGGKVVISNSDRITSGIPMDNPQFAQLDLAREALKDFDYHWAKIVFNTFEDTLDVKMELNGKPSKVLPFEYKKEFGGFVRVDASSPGSQFEGIKLDVNLKLPFNDVMKFGNKIKSILN
ncbi:MAG: YdbH domain-containing protein [Deltaproteobacteria bacterium]|uniref:intermembrane phospholipid transport protein YdbH family protein n=1 Tax=Desulfobacula sp. TaxID=2593537 RepID=UPI0019BB4C8B|nr:YdbH domain-containing protein [Candidatus Desulfobacula maris]MBL6994553.1 YdbH domain-containing protein [Desulfobacula sp.]